MTEFLAYRWADPAYVVTSLLRLQRPPYNPAEIAWAWGPGTDRFEWWMTKIGTFPDHCHRFQFVKIVRTFDEVFQCFFEHEETFGERVQWGYSGNFEKIEDDTLKNFRALELKVTADQDYQKLLKKWAKEKELDILPEA